MDITNFYVIKIFLPRSRNEIQKYAEDKLRRKHNVSPEHSIQGNSSKIDLFLYIFPWNTSTLVHSYFVYVKTTLIQLSTFRNFYDCLKWLTEQSG